MIDLSALTITKARAALDAGEYSAVDLAQAYLDAIAEKDTELHAYLEVYDDVLDQARRADAMMANGDTQSLTGIPIAIKDNILVEGKRASAASKILEGYVAPYGASVIKKLQAQGVVLLGRTNMDEFAMGGSTENSAYGPSKNPHDTNRVPGGSSGGSAVTVASGMALAALGSDTGGSIRQPAAFCGVIGLKPTYGTVSRFGLMAMGSSLDQIGTFTRTTEDAQILFDAIKGYDANDSTSLPDGSLKSSDTHSKVVGVPRAFLTSGVDEDVLARFEEGLEKMRTLGYEVRDIELPSLAGTLAAYYIIMPAEASTNLARFDGIRYGYSAARDTIQEVYDATRREGFGREVQRRILTGAFVLSSGYVDAYYRRAMAIRATLRAELAQAFEHVDAIALPTTPSPAFRIGEKSNPVAMYAADIFTVPVNLAGVPALSIPCGTVEREDKKLPVGLQLIAAHGEEEMLFKMSSDIEADLA